MKPKTLEIYKSVNIHHKINARSDIPKQNKGVFLVEYPYKYLESKNWSFPHIK